MIVEQDLAESGISNTGGVHVIHEGYSLDPKLAAESFPLGKLALSEVRLFDDARFPWLLLIPQRTGLVEIIDLAPAELSRLSEEIALASGVLEAATSPFKLNVAALGNVVRQLHVHVIARFETDEAWPNPVWGRGQRVPYDPTKRESFEQHLRRGFGFTELRRD